MLHSLAPLGQSLGLAWVLVILYALWRLWRRQWIRALPPLLAAGVIFVFGATRLPASLLASLERPYAGRSFTNLPPSDVVVMLGGVLQPSRNDVFGFEFGNAMDRLVTAVQVVHLTGAKALVLGGGVPTAREGDPVEGEFDQRWLTAWGQPGVPVFTLGPCRNTHDEAGHARELIEKHGWKRIILVTSAAHMRRSEALFRHEGLTVLPVACDFRALASFERDQGPGPIPSLEGFELLDLYLHEQIGWWLYRARGWL